MTAYMEHKNLANETIDAARAGEIAGNVHAVLDRVAAAEQAAGKQVQIAHLPVGHNQMTEAPEETLAAIRDFLAR